jgi:hypothetical protein
VVVEEEQIRRKERDIALMKMVCSALMEMV